MSEQPTLVLIVIDENRKQFTVEGPLTDGAAWKCAKRRPAMTVAI
jgi:hypothetical protein